MAALFNPNTKVLCSDQTELYANNKWILWPYLAYKVIVPYPSDKEFNLFQEYIIRLLELGISDKKKIAEKLCLKEPLVEFIIKQLQDLNWIDENKIPNQSCLMMLNNSEDDCERIPGWVFKDLVGNYFLDVFSPELDEVNASTGGFSRKFSYGSAGYSREVSASVVFPVNNSDYVLDEKPPGPVKIIEACIKHKVRINKIRRGESGSQVDNLSVKLPKDLTDIEIVGNGEPVLIATRIYLQPSDTEWLVKHPFGTFNSTRLKSDIELLIQNDSYKHLKDIIIDLIQQNNVVIQDVKQVDKNIDLLKSQYGDKILKFPQLCSYLTDYTNKIALLQFSEKKKTDNIYDDLALLGYKIVSELLYILMSKIGDDSAYKVLSKDPVENAELLSKISIQKCGFKCNNLARFTKMLKVKKGAVEKCSDSKELNSLLAVNLLLSVNFQQHPFYRLADIMPNFVEDLYEIKELRKLSSHDGNKEITADQISSQKSYLDNLLNFFLKSAFTEGDANSSSAIDNDTKLDRLAKANINAEFGVYFDESAPAFYDYVYKIEHNLLSLSAYQSDAQKQNIIEQIVIQINNSLEHIFSMMSKDVSFDYKSSIVEFSKDQNLSKLKNSCTKYGFHSAKIPASCEKIDPKKIRDAFNHYQTATLNCKIYALMLAASDETDVSISKVGKQIPKLMEFTFYVTDLRGHGIGMSVTTDEIQQIKVELYGIIKTILKILKD